MPRTESSRSVQERILSAAFDLFYRQGYRATGINQIIAESGVAKASFYDHFPAKDDLLLAYVRETSQREIADLRSEVSALPTVRDRFTGPLKILPPWLHSSAYRGCPFQNVASEVPTDNDAVRDAVLLHRKRTRSYFRELIDDLIASDPKLAALDADELADIYLVIFEGAIAAAVAYRDPWPITRAIATLERLADGP